MSHQYTSQTIPEAGQEMSNYGQAQPNPQFPSAPPWNHDDFTPEAERLRQQEIPLKNPPGTWNAWSLSNGLFAPQQQYSIVGEQRPPPEAKHNPKEPGVAWGIHWYTPASIATLLFLAVGGAIGHHLYYSSLDEQLAGTASEQQWVTRIGTALAFLIKAALATAVMISRQQRVWVSLRQKFLSLYAIDALFGVTDDFFQFFNGEMVVRAKTATLMAVVRWTIPIAAIFTPGTISVIATVKLNSTSCTVPTLRFPYDFTTASHLVGPNQTLPNSTVLGEEWRIIYRAPSAAAKKIFTLSAYSGDIAAGVPDVEGTTLHQDCGPKCNYAVSFEGPALQCFEEIPWNSTRTPWFQTMELIPTTVGSNYNYVQGTLGTEFVAGMGNYSRKDANTSDVLWVGHRITLSNDPDLPAKKRYEPHVYSCQNSVGRYNVSVEVRDNRLVSTVDSVDILYPIPHNYPFTDNTINYTANWAVMDVLGDILGGDATVTPSGPSGSYSQLSTTDTSVGSTPLTLRANNNELRTVPNLGAAIEKMAHSMIASLLAERSLIYSAAMNSTCHSTRFHNVYRYNARTLVIVYCTAIAIALLMAALGGVSLVQNGVAHDTSFSTMVATTRNPRLDYLFTGACLGRIPLRKELGKTKMMFGEQVKGAMYEEGRVEHAAFGLKGEVRRLKKGGRYL